jgi:hypothetical protein
LEQQTGKPVVLARYQHLAAGSQCLASSGEQTLAASQNAPSEVAGTPYLAAEHPAAGTVVVAAGIAVVDHMAAELVVKGCGPWVGLAWVVGSEVALGCHMIAAAALEEGSAQVDAGFACMEAVGLGPHMEVGLERRRMLGGLPSRSSVLRFDGVFSEEGDQ